MKTFIILLITFHSLYCFSYIDKTIEYFVLNSQKPIYIKDKVEIHTESDLISCKAIKLRLRRVAEIDEELDGISQSGEELVFQILDQIGLKEFLLRQKIKFYVLKLDKELHQFQIDLEKINFYENDLLMSFYAGENKLSLPVANELRINKSHHLELDFSNYQFCMDKSISLLVIKNCPVKKFSHLDQCMNSEVLRYELEIPEVNRAEGSLRRK